MSSNNNTETLPEDMWANGFHSASTRPVLSALSRRLQASSTHTHALSELYRERALIEQEYSTKLAKLARSAEAGQLSGKGAVEWERNSAESKIFDAVVSDLNETSSAHSTLSAMIKSDFEQPVRDLPNKIPSWRRVHDQEQSLDRTLKDYEKTSAKLEKAASKAKASSKTDQLSADLSQITNSLASLTPMVYSTFQKLDEDRLRSLKEIAVRWATVRADMATRDGERSEASLTKLLSWESQDEVTSTGLRIASACGGKPGQARPPPERATASPVSTIGTVAGGASSTPARRMSVQTTSTAGAPDFGPRRANGSTSNLGTTSGGGGGFSGIKSMLTRKATVSGRQRSGSEAPSMRSTRQTTNDMFSPLEEGDFERRSVRQEPQRSQSDRAETLRSQTSGPPPPVDEEGYSIAPADRHRNPWVDPTELVPTPAAQGTAAATTTNGVSLPSTILADQQRSTSPDASHPSSAAGSFNDGPSRINLAMSASPIQESDDARQAALAKMQQTLQKVPGAPTRRTTLARGRREARHTIQPDSSAVSPEHMRVLAKMGEEEERLAGDSPTNTLSVRGHDIGRKASLTSLSSSRNPFDSPGLGQGGQAFSPSSTSNSPIIPGVAAAAGAAVVAGGAGLGAAAFRNASGNTDASISPAGPEAQRLVTENQRPTSDPVITQSPVAMQGSLPPAESPATDAPPVTSVSAMVAPGLRATMVETVHAFIRQFASQRTVVTGEVHLSLAASANRPLPPPGSAIHIRLTEFDVLESVAPNPAFLVQVPDRPGEYYLNADVLAQATISPEVGGLGPVLFKYHALVPEGAETTMAPLILNPAFQVKDGETRMILHYRAQGSTVTNLSLVATFPDQPAVTGTQSKPVTGSWGAASDGSNGRQISWSLDDAHSGAEGKVVARFITPPGSGRLAPTGVTAHFIVPNYLVSGLGVEIVDDEGAKDLPTVSGWAFDDVRRSTISGKYVGDVALNP